MMAEGRLRQAEAFLQFGELEDALAALDALLDEQPGDDAARRLRAAVRQRRRDAANLQAALADLDALVAPAPDDDLQRSVILEALGDIAGAEAAVARARAARPDDERAAQRHFRLLLRRRDFDAARRLLAHQPQAWDWLAAAGELEAEAGDEPAAIAHFTAALADFDRRFDARAEPFARPLKAALLLARAQAAAALGRFAAAEADYDAALALVPDDRRARFLRGLAAAGRGDPARALEGCRAALATSSPDERAALLALLRSLLDQDAYRPLAVLLD